MQSYRVALSGVTFLIAYLIMLMVSGLPLFFLELDAVSTTLSKESMPTNQEITADAIEMLDSHEKGSAAVFIGHSFGTTVLASVLDRRLFHPLGGPGQAGQTLKGSFSAVSTPNFAVQASFETSRRYLQN